MWGGSGFALPLPSPRPQITYLLLVMFAITRPDDRRRPGQVVDKHMTMFVHGNLILIHEQLTSTTDDELFLLLEIMCFVDAGL